jgi:SAM-dependent methyltransferase
MLKLIARVARQVNWSRRRWSTASDRAFHEQLYHADDYNPFSLSYPGYTTIRRFADLVEPHLPTAGCVVDLGCGPGEITCELAARRPDLRFRGIDHSAAAIVKAHANLLRRGVANVAFTRAGVEDYEPESTIDLVTMFDAFHHVVDPEAFISRLNPHVKRWALIEPRGSWLGTWQKDLDFDWIAQDLDNIRAHVAADLTRLETTQPQTKSPAPAPAPGGEPVERRYTLDDFRRFFEGLELDLQGTVAGLQTYPPGAHDVDEVRERFGEIRYELYRDVDRWLLERNLDLHAKHWLIVAERGGHSRSVALSAAPPDMGEHIRVAGAFDIQYGEYHGPLEARSGERIMATVSVTNTGWDEWSSDGTDAIFASYHWLDSQGRVIVFDGERTPLPRTIGQGATCEIAVAATAPEESGRYRLAIDLVREGVTWFSQAGHPCLEVPFRVV